jgi:glycosyltransferase involved in cell wall biosynthesis
MSKRKMLVDGQVFQTTAKDRGMGRFAICLLQAVLRKSDHDVEIILTSELPFKEKDAAELTALFPGVRFRKLNLWTTQKHTIERAFEHNTAVLTKYVQSVGAADVEYFIPSLFQEPVVAVFPERARAKTILFHDLIPYLYHERYQPVMMYENYLKRFRYIFEADLIFTNSQTVADDLSMYLGVPKNKLCRIDGAAIHTDTAVEKPAHIDLPDSFILLNTSDDPRKNNMRTVLGFEEFRVASKRDLKLVLTSTIHKREQERLRAVSNNLIFIGNIPESQLNWLYDHCELVLFAPESEGLGLPLLEAVDAKKKVVCSSIPVLQEVSPSEDAFYYCDHENSYSIARALERAFEPGAALNAEAYKAMRTYYTWDNAAGRMLKGLASVIPKQPVKKPKIAIFTATPSGLSGVGLTASVLHPVVADAFDVEYYLEPGLSGAKIRPNYLQYVVPCYPAHAFSVQRYAKYDAVFYHMGNGDYHMESIKNALYLPGYVIVHDTNLREAFRVLREANMMSDDRVKLEEAIDESNGTTMSSYYSSIANRQLGLLTHSSFATQAMHEVLDVPVPVVRSGLPTNVPSNTYRRTGDKIVIGLAGAIADVKGLDVIEAIAEDVAFTDCEIRLFGFNHASKEKIDQLRSYSNVSIATNVSDYDFQTSFAKLDIFVNYRMIYKGETSNTTLESMRQGVVTMVRDIGWFSELDDKAVVKAASPEEIIEKLRHLVKDKKRLHEIGEYAKSYTEKTFTQESYVEHMQKLLAEDQTHNPNAHVAAQLRSGKIKRLGQLIMGA